MPLRWAVVLPLFGLLAPVWCTTRAAVGHTEGEHEHARVRDDSTRAGLLKDAVDLPPLSHSFAPWNPVTWRNTVALCATMRHENITDVVEWLSYYRWLGVEHVYLTENSADKTRAVRAALQPFLDDGFVTFRVDPIPKAQLDVYKQCIEEHRMDHNWMAFFDLDEFLVITEEGATLRDVLDDYKFFAGVTVWWVMVGSSDKLQRPAAGGVLRTYTRCESHGRGVSKIIANMFYAGRIAGTPHNLQHRGALPAVTEDLRPLSMVFLESCQRDFDAGNVTDCRLVPEWGVDDDSQSSIARLSLFHYVLKSEEDFKVKSERGGGVRGAGKPFSFFEAMTARANTTSALCSLPSSLAEACCSEAEQLAALRRFNLA